MNPKNNSSSTASDEKLLELKKTVDIATELCDDKYDSDTPCQLWPKWAIYLLSLLVSYDEIVFTRATVAFLGYLCFGYDIGSHDLPINIKSALLLMAPSIKISKENYANGKKGAKFGKQGGRPKKETNKNPGGLEQGNPPGLGQENPGGLKQHNPILEEDEKQELETRTKKRQNDNICVDVVVNNMGTHESTHTDFLEVFFFRNCLNPVAEAKKFTDFYEGSKWTLPGGDVMSTDGQKLALAQRWDIKNDPCKRFSSDALDMWRSIYNVAPTEIKTSMLSNSIKLTKDKEVACVTAPANVCEWMGGSTELIRPMVKKWMGKLKLAYISLQN